MEQLTDPPNFTRVMQNFGLRTCQSMFKITMVVSEQLFTQTPNSLNHGVLISSEIDIGFVLDYSIKFYYLSFKYSLYYIYLFIIIINQNLVNSVKIFL